MITHNCLNIINKNFTVILISFLYLAKLFSNKTTNNTFLSLICIKNVLLQENPSMDSYIITGKLHADVWFCSIFKHENLMNFTLSTLAYHDTCHKLPDAFLGYLGTLPSYQIWYPICQVPSHTSTNTRLGFKPRHLVTKNVAINFIQHKIASRAFLMWSIT